MSRDWLRPALSCIFPPATSFPRSWVWHFLTRNGCSFPVETYTGASVPRSTLALGRPRVCVTKFHSGTGKIWRGEPFWYLISSGGYAKRFGEITMKITLKYTVVIHNVMRTTVICFCLRLMEIKCPLRTVSSQACDGSARSMNGSRSGVFRARSTFQDSLKSFKAFSP